MVNPQDVDSVWISTESMNYSLNTEGRYANQHSRSFVFNTPAQNKRNEMYKNICGAKIFNMLDLQSDYYHISLDKDSKAKTAFVTPFGKYEFNAVPFRLAQVHVYFRQLMYMILQDCGNFVIAYLDNIIIFRKDEQ